jgi:hypothetical protein
MDLKLGLVPRVKLSQFRPSIVTRSVRDARASWYGLGMPERSRKRPTDVNELAKRLVDEAIGDKEKTDPDAGKDPAAVALGRKGGLKGGKARAASMTPEQRSEAARHAARQRWPSS